MTIKIVDKDRGAKSLEKRLQAFKNFQIIVGIDADAGASIKDGTSITLLEVATANEFGTDDIPERSFIRGYFDENAELVQRILLLEAERVFKGADPEQALRRAAIYFRSQIQKRIADRIEPANAQSTIDRKGSDTPLIDTGQLRASIDGRVERV